MASSARCGVPPTRLRAAHAKSTLGGADGRGAASLRAAPRWARGRDRPRVRVTPRAHASPSSPSITSAPEGSREADVLAALRNVIDPDFGEDVVELRLRPRI